jgi:predicted CoA-binding protein
MSVGIIARSFKSLPGLHNTIASKAAQFNKVARSVSSSRGDPDKFFASNTVFAVVGASNDPTKFGNKVFKCYLSHNKTAVPISKSTEIEGKTAYPNLTAFLTAQTAAGVTVDKVGVSIITPPTATASVISEGIGLGIKSFFLQPGTTNEAVAKIMDDEGNKSINFVEGCVLVELGCDR